MAENLAKQPKKGILKNSLSFETHEREKEAGKETKWDEMNILATLHPQDKDYGHMKIEEPKTPYAYSVDDEASEECDGLDADLLAKKIQLGSNELPKAMVELESEESDEEETPEEREKRKAFESKRKKHYNEFYAVKLARKLMERDDDDDEDEQIDMVLDDKETENSGSGVKSVVNGD